MVDILNRMLGKQYSTFGFAAIVLSTQKYIDTRLPFNWESVDQFTTYTLTPIDAR